MISYSNQNQSHRIIISDIVTIIVEYYNHGEGLKENTYLFSTITQINFLAFENLQ